MSPGCLILDCDGVLADTERDGHLVAFNQAFAEAGLPCRWSVEEYARLVTIGGGKERLSHYLRAHPEAGIADDAVEDCVLALHQRKSALYVEMVEAGRLPGRPGVRRLVGETLDEGWRVAVASTSAQRSVEAVLVAVVGAENRARMSGVWAGDVVSAKKPAPDVYLLALAELSQDPERAVVIEDSGTGAQAAAAAGLRHVVTLSSLTADDAFPDAATVVRDLGERGHPATVVAGADVRDDDGLIAASSLARVLETTTRPTAR